MIFSSPALNMLNYINNSPKANTVLFMEVNMEAYLILWIILLINKV